MKEIILKVEGIECGGCEKRIENAVGTINGVSKVKASHENGTVTITLEQEVEQAVIEQKIEDIGFTVEQ